MVDPAEHRTESRRRWGVAASGWKRNISEISRTLMPVTEAMLDGLAPQPGQDLVELAAGTGDVGLMAAELVRPGGTLVISDFAPQMLTAAQERAEELGVRDVRFKQIDAHSIDLDAASVDGVLCRFGYMLMTDPASALRETRRILKPGGRVAAAVWASADENPWMGAMRRPLQARGLLEHDLPGDPGPFSWADPEDVRSRFADAGFDEDVDLRAVDLAFPYPDFETFVRVSREMGARVGEILAAMDDAERDAVLAGVREAFAPYEQSGGAYLLPARALVAVATA